MLLYLILLIILIFIIIRTYLIYNLSNYTIGKKNHNDVILLYDDYYKNSKKKLNNKLRKNIGIIRPYYFDNEYDFDIKMLDLKENMKILITNTLDIDFEKTIIDKFLKKNKKIYVFSCCNNLIETHFLKKNNKYYNLYINYCNTEDIFTKFKDIKFDRIVMRENLGNINNRFLFFKNIKNLLKDKESFIYMKTFTFNNKIEHPDIFEKQKYLIDYWNYNFSTNQVIINELIKLKYIPKFTKINLLDLSILGNISDIIKHLKLFFIDLDKNINDINIWFVIYSLELSIYKIYI